MWLIAIVLACFAGYHMCALSLSCCMRSIGRCSCAACAQRHGTPCMFPPARQRCAASCSWNAALNVTTNESYKSVLRQRTHARAHTLTARYLRMVPVSPASPVELARAARLDGRWSALCGMVACGSGEGAADSLMGARSIGSFHCQCCALRSARGRISGLKSRRHRRTRCSSC